MTVTASLRTKLERGLSPLRLEIRNESARHAGHGPQSGTETHFAILVVADAFSGLGRIERHRMVHALLAEELAAPIHALSLIALTPAEDRAA